MSNVTSRLRAVLGAATLTAFLLMISPASAAFTQRDVLIKGPNSGAVYYLANNGKRYVFPNAKTYSTWFSNFSGVLSVSSSDLTSFPLGGNVTYRPGIRLVKVTTDPKVYAVDANGTLRWVSSLAVAKALYGDSWNTKVDDVPDAFFVNYRIGKDIYSSVDYSPFVVASASTTINADRDISSGGYAREADTSPDAPTQSVVPPVPVIVPPSATACSSDTWACTDWDACNSSGMQTRTCALKIDCPQSSNSSPIISQACNPSSSSGTISVINDTEAGSVAAGTDAVLAKFRLSAGYEDMRLTKASFNVAAPSAVLSLRLYDGDLPVSSGTSVNSAGDAIFSTVDFVIPRNTAKDLTVRGHLNSVGPTGAASGANAKVTMKSTGGPYVFEMKGAQPTSQTVITAIPGGDLSGNDKFVGGTVPSVSAISLPSTVLTAGDVVAARFSVTAGLSGDMAVKTMTVDLQKPFAAAIAVTGDSAHSSIREYGSGTLIAGHSTASAGCAANAGTFCQIRTMFDSELGIAAGSSKTLDVRVNVSGSLVSGDSLSAIVDGDTQAVSGPLTAGSFADSVKVNGTDVSFSWSDESASPHTYDVGGVSGDWSSGAYLKVLPTDVQVLVK